MKRIRLFSLFTIIFSLSSFAQKEKYQSLFIYNFTKYIKWPDTYNAGKFVIGVFGDSDILEALNVMALSKKKTSAGLAIEVIQYSSIAEIDDCNILFVAPNSAGDLGQIENKTSSKPILIVTDSPGLANQGAIINFVDQNGKIKFELNESNASSRGLIVSSSLINLAILI